MEFVGGKVRIVDDLLHTLGDIVEGHRLAGLGAAVAFALGPHRLQNHVGFVAGFAGQDFVLRVAQAGFDLRTEVGPFFI